MSDIVGFRRRACRSAVTVLAIVAALAACSGSSSGPKSSDNDPGSNDSGRAIGSSAEVCALLDAGEIESLLGATLTPQPGSGSPYPSCSWQGGRLIVQVAAGTSVVTAPGQDCPTVDIGDEALECPGSVQFVKGGSRVIVQTIEDVTGRQLVAVAKALQPKIEAGS